MEYRRRIQESKYYKELISEYDKKIEEINHNIEELYEEKKELEGKKELYSNNWKKFKQREKELNDELTGRMIKSQKIEDITFFTAASGLGILAINLLPNLPHDGTIDAYTVHFLQYVASAMFAGLTIFIDINEIRTNNPEKINNSTIERAYKKNSKLVNNIRDNEKRLNDSRNMLDRTYHNIANINFELMYNKNKLDKISKEKKSIVNLVSRYDNISMLERFANDEINLKQLESNKHATKVFKKTRDYRKYYEKRIRSH